MLRVRSCTPIPGLKPGPWVGVIIFRGRNTNLQPKLSTHKSKPASPLNYTAEA